MSMNYLESAKVKVFPCAYRGENSTSTTVIDPESKLNTEFNFVHTGRTVGRNSYIISYATDAKKVCCVISGYYFELDFTDKTLSNYKFAHIKTKQVTIAGNATTEILTTCELNSTSNDNYLDASGNFLGIGFSSTKDTSYTLSLQLFNDSGNIYEPNFLNLDYNKIASANTVDSLPGIFAVGTATNGYSMRQINYDADAGGWGTNTASGTNSIALGVGTEAGHKNQVVLGTHNNNKPTDIFEIGNGSADTNKHNILEVGGTFIDDTDSGFVNINGKLTVENELSVNKASLTLGTTSSSNIPTITFSTDSYSNTLTSSDSSLTYNTGVNPNIASLALYTTGTTKSNLPTGLETKSLKVTGTTTDDVSTIANGLTISGAASQHSALRINTNHALTGASIRFCAGSGTNADAWVVGGFSATSDTSLTSFEIWKPSQSINSFIFNSTGQITATSFNARSDRRLKENIENYTTTKSILDLQTYKYDFIDGPKNQIGCIAQELQEIAPELVKEDEKGYLSIQESKLVYLLLEEVKKLKKEIEDLKK